MPSRSNRKERRIETQANSSIAQAASHTPSTLRAPSSYAPIKAIIFDLDGTLVRGARALPGAVSAVEKLLADGLCIAYCTQDSLRPPAKVADKLAGLGFPAVADDVICSGWAAARRLADLYGEGPIYAICGDELRQTFLDYGCKLVDERNYGDARAVFVGRDPDFSAARISYACRAIWNGAHFYGVGHDRVLPLEGRDSPGAGGVVKAIEYATRKPARILGKPSRALAEAAMARLGSRPEETIVVGDNLGADIRLGALAGCRTALVLTGATTREQAHRAKGTLRPDVVLETVGDLVARLGGARA